MQIRYGNIVLRDEEERDIDDEIRWNTVETQWALWDAPWETEEELAAFDPEQYRREALASLQKPRRGVRWSLEVDTAEGVHIGGVNAYLTDEHFQYVPESCAKPGHPLWVTAGIEINESAYWGKGYGTQALAAFIQYHLDMGHRNIATQTWSGNTRMIRAAQKLGFRLCRRDEGARQVRGGAYDALSFCLDTALFEMRYGAARHVDELVLVEPDIGHVEQVMRFRDMLLERKEGFDGCAELENVQTCAEWLRFDERLKAMYGERYVPSIVCIAVRPADGEVVGIIDWRRELNDFLLNFGGSIGYTVRPDMRRRGYGARMLALMLDKCREQGAERVLLTCDQDNEASRRTIVRCGGILENEVEDTVGLSQNGIIQRYWIELNK